MRDRAGLFAACVDSLAVMCLYYAAAGILIMGSGWGVHLVLLLFWTAICSFIFAFFLKKPRAVPSLIVLTGFLVLAGFAFFAFFSSTPLRFGYGFVLAVGAGMAAGLPLYFALHRPKISSHLTQLDLLIIVLLVLLLTKDALGLDNGTVALTASVLFLNAAAAIGLRMSEGGSAESGSAFKASMVALAAAAVLALVIWLLSLLFAGSGSVTGGVLHGIGAFFASVGGALERFLRWLTGLFARREHYDALELDLEMPSLAEAELSDGGAEIALNTTALGIALCVLAVAAAVAAALLLRRRTVSRRTAGLSSGGEQGVRRTGGTVGEFWRRLRLAAAFRWTAFLNRDTPPGLLVLLERMSGRAGAPRGRGETIRAFLTRMDPGGGLEALADALDLQFYGSGSDMSGKSCRELRRYIRRTLRPSLSSQRAKTGGGT